MGEHWLSWLDLFLALLSLAGVFLLWRLIERRGRGVIPARLVARMLELERDIRAVTQKLDAMAFAEGERETERKDISIRMLDTVRRVESKMEVQNRKLTYIGRLVEDRPCIMNESNNGGESCPDGQPIEGAGKMDVYREEGEG